MKKMILAASLFGVSLCTPAVFATSCQFTITLNSVWNGYKSWPIIFTNISDTDIVEVVGGPQLLRDTNIKGDKYQMIVPVNNCSNSTQIGMFTHSPGSGPFAAESSYHDHDKKEANVEGGECVN